MILHIKAVEGKDMPKMDAGLFTCDPYLVFKLNTSKKSWKTKVKKQTYTPVWNEEFHIPVTNSSDEILHVELYDHDKLSADDLISTRDFQLTTLPVGKVIDTWYTFFKSHRAKNPGNVHLVLHLAHKDDKPFVDTFATERSVDFDPLITPFSEEEIEEARYQFQSIDSNENGILEENELDRFFSSSRRELLCFSKLIVEIYGKNGGVTLDQFLTFYKALSADRNSNEYLGRHIFDYIDSDHSGEISSTEFQKVIDLIKFPAGTKTETINAAKNMDYAAFSNRFYTIIKMVWSGRAQRTYFTPE